jgi:hypothetical protein
MGADFGIQLLARLSSVGFFCRCNRLVAAAGGGVRCSVAAGACSAGRLCYWAVVLAMRLLARWTAAVSIGDPCLAGRLRRLDRLSRRLAGSGL